MDRQRAQPVPAKWEAEIINDIPNKLIAWRSLGDADVISAGSVNFDTVRNGRMVTGLGALSYAAPRRPRRRPVERRSSGREPSQTVREDLRRLKQLLEAGEFPHAKWDTEWM